MPTDPRNAKSWPGVILAHMHIDQETVFISTLARLQWRVSWITPRGN